MISKIYCKYACSLNIKVDIKKFGLSDLRDGSPVRLSYSVWFFCLCNPATRVAADSPLPLGLYRVHLTEKATTYTTPNPAGP